ncbi:MAG TPA: Na/Pi symporter [Pseudomonadales bacterium]|nr:Na/Pi symporter [Pseudomonadales bacterium]
MTTETTSPASTSAAAHSRIWLIVASLVYVLLTGVGLIGDGFKLSSGGAEGAARIFEFASNPFVGVLLGTLATGLVQSSSTVTSVIVGLVAGGLPVGVAIPMIMGANMGTTVTNTIVAMAAMRDGETFRRSFAAATVHDIFNLMAIAILLPLEILFHPLERLAGACAAFLAGGGSASIKDFNFVALVTDPAVDAIAAVASLLPGTLLSGIAMILVGISLVILSVLRLGSALRKAMVGRALDLLHGALGRGPLLGIGTGTLVTVLVQSSSTTTSLIVPLAGSGTLSLKQVYPFTLGANIGTTVTALLAATAISGEFETVALQIALVHFLFNVIAVFAATYVPILNQIPIRGATWLGELAQRSKGMAIAYLFGVFFIIPGIAFVVESSIEADRRAQAQSLVPPVAPVAEAGKGMGG